MSGCAAAAREHRSLSDARADQVSGTVSTGQDEFVAPPEACRSGEQTLSVQRQAVEHLFETDF